MAVKTKAKKTMDQVYPSAYQVARNIETMMRENKDSLSAISELLNISRTTLWRRLNKAPYEISLKELCILSEYWGVDIAVLTRPPFGRSVCVG